jgi:hypothetical protein
VATVSTLLLVLLYEPYTVISAPVPVISAPVPVIPLFWKLRSNPRTFYLVPTFLCK